MGKRQASRSHYHKAAKRSSLGGYDGPAASAVKITRVDGTVEIQAGNPPAPTVKREPPTRRVRPRDAVSVHRTLDCTCGGTSLCPECGERVHVAGKLISYHPPCSAR